MASASWSNVPLYEPTLADLMVKRKEAIDVLTTSTAMCREEAERFVVMAEASSWPNGPFTLAPMATELNCTFTPDDPKAFMRLFGGRNFGKTEAVRAYRKRLASMSIW